MQKMLNNNDENANRKKKNQYQSWNDNVYNALQDGIKEHMNATVSAQGVLKCNAPSTITNNHPPARSYHAHGPLFTQDSKALNQRKREEYQQFLDAMNEKGAIFRDIIIESDYDPLVANTKGIKFQSARIEDPTKRVLQKGEEEAKMIHPGGASTAQQKNCRDTFDVAQWATGKVEASPHGHFTKMFRNSGPSSNSNPTQKSNVVFDQYNYPTGKAAVDCELPKGKKMDW
jgi:hypothetical protein